MYLRHTIRKKDGKVHRYWSLARGVRVGRWVTQQRVAHLGEPDGSGRVAVQALARRLIGAPKQAALFDDRSEQFTVSVRVNVIRHGRARQFGDFIWRCGEGLA